MHKPFGYGSWFTYGTGALAITVFWYAMGLTPVTLTFP